MNVYYLYWRAIIFSTKAWELWKTEFLYICNKHAPLKLSRVKQTSSPWLINDILDLMYQRDYLLKKAIARNSESDYNAFKLSKNKVNFEVKKSKKDVLYKFFYFYNFI